MAPCAAGAILDDPAAAMVAALQDPVGYPPLARAVVPGDRVVISVDPAVPQVPQVVAGVVRTLMSADVNPADIVVLTSRTSDPDAGWARELPAAASAVTVIAHDPRDKARAVLFGRRERRGADLLESALVRGRRDRAHQSAATSHGDRL